MKNVRDVVSRDIIEDLWGAGYTILPRRRHADPFHVPQEMVPQGRSYQWWHLVHDKFHFERPDGATPSGWAPVPASRHDGYFMPAGHVGDIEVNGLGLFEKSKFEVDQELQAERQKAIDAAYQTKFFAGKGFSGSVTVGHQNQAGFVATRMDIDKKSKTINTTVAIPKDMLPHMSAVFEERDALYNDLVEKWNTGKELSDQEKAICEKYEEALAEDPETLKGPTLNALLMPTAIENVRKRITEEASSGQAS